MQNKTYRQLLEPSGIYHVYNHGNAGDNIFRNEENYYYFLRKYAEYILPVAETYAYCLMPNHFHFTLKIRAHEQLVKTFQDKYTGQNLQGYKDLTGLISKQFSNFFNAYSKAFNKKYDRTGALFRDYFKRKKVENSQYLMNLIHYIHHNPVHHNLVSAIHEWTYSSYHAYITSKKTALQRDEVIALFEGSEQFIKVHIGKPNLALLADLEY